MRSAFARAARRLEGLARGRRSSDVQIDYLEALFSVKKVCRRSVAVNDDFFTVVEAPPPRRAAPGEVRSRLACDALRLQC